MKSIIAVVFALVCFNGVVYGNDRDRRATVTLKYQVDHGPLTSCKQPSARVMSFCNMNYSIPSSMADGLVKHLNYIVDYMNTNAGSYSAQCLIHVKRIVCGGLLPQCSSDLTTLTYPDISQSCLSVSSCPTGLFTAMGRTASSLCVYSSRQFALNSCVNSGFTTLNAAYCKAFPNVTVPAWRVPDLQRQAGNIIPARVGYSVIGASQECISKWTQFLCNAISTCNAAKNRVITSGWSKEECQDAIQCLPSIVRSATEAQIDCNVFASQSGSPSSFSIHLGLIAITSILLAMINS